MDKSFDAKVGGDSFNEGPLIFIKKFPARQGFDIKQDTARWDELLEIKV